MSYIMEFRLMQEPINDILDSEKEVDVADFELLPFFGSLHHASMSGEEFCDCLADCVGVIRAGFLINRQGINPFYDEGDYTSYGGMTASEVAEALDLVEKRIASGVSFPDDDCEEWAHELRSILSEAAKTKQNIITIYG